MKGRLAEDSAIGDKLHFDDHREDEKLCVITDGETVFATIAKGDLPELLESDAKCLDSVPYRKISANTLKRDAEAAPPPPVDWFEFIPGLWAELKRGGFRRFINAHQGLAALVFITAFVVALSFGLASSCSRPPRYVPKDKDFKSMFADTEQKLAKWCGATPNRSWPSGAAPPANRRSSAIT